jgi:hypothetical protein
MDKDTGPSSEAAYEKWSEIFDPKSNPAYAILMLKLQELCGMTDREARMYLSVYVEHIEDLVKDYGISTRELRKIYQSAELKMERSGHSLHCIMKKYGRLPYIDF